MHLPYSMLRACMRPRLVAMQVLQEERLGCASDICNKHEVAIEPRCVPAQASAMWGMQVLQKERVGYPSDVWALGVTLNELATGTFPYSDCTRDNPAAHTVLEMGYGRSARLLSCGDRDPGACRQEAGLQPTPCWRLGCDWSSNCCSLASFGLACRLCCPSHASLGAHLKDVRARADATSAARMRQECCDASSLVHHAICLTCHQHQHIVPVA